MKYLGKWAGILMEILVNTSQIKNNIDCICRYDY